MSQRIEGGYILQPRCIENSDISSSPPHVREVWNYLLRNANHSDKKYKGYELKRGQLFRKHEDIIKDLSWKVGYRTESYTKDQMKASMNALRKAGMIATTKTPRGTLITICNYCFYQDPKNYESTNETTNESTNENTTITPTTTPSINKNERIQECNSINPLYPLFLKTWCSEFKVPSLSLSMSAKNELELQAEKYTAEQFHLAIQEAKQSAAGLAGQISTPKYLRPILEKIKNGITTKRETVLERSARELRAKLEAEENDKNRNA